MGTEQSALDRARAKIAQGTPKGPAPQPPGGPPAEAADWADPIPLDGPDPSLPPFPLDVFPDGLRDLCDGIAESVGCPADYPAAHALAVAAGAVGARYDLQVKRGFYAPSSLWVCVVAPPGSGKSPGVAPVLAPVFAEQARRRQRGGEKPVYVSDVTVEKLVRLLDADPRGLLMVWDEMAGWLTSFNQYKAKGSGNDRAHYLSIWDGRATKVDRAGVDAPPVFVQRPRLSVVGGIQPEVLDTLREGPSDGLFDRMLFSYPADPGLAVESFNELDDGPCGEWARAVERLWNRPMKADPDGDRPNVVTLTEGGRPVWQDWTRVLADRAARADAPPYFRAVAAKIQGYAARLALVCHLIHEAYADAVRDFGLGEESMHRGVRLADYFLAHAHRVRQASGRDTRLAKAKAVLRWAVGAGKEKFTRPDAWASLRNNSAFAGPEDLDEPLRRLTLHRCVRWVRSGGGAAGRPPQGGGHYELNPGLLQGPESERTV